MEWISNLIFEFNDAQILFGMFQEFKKATPYGGARKLRLTLPPAHRVRISKGIYIDRHVHFVRLKNYSFWISIHKLKQPHWRLIMPKELESPRWSFERKTMFGLKQTIDKYLALKHTTLKRTKAREERSFSLSRLYCPSHLSYQLIQLSWRGAVTASFRDWLQYRHIGSMSVDFRNLLVAELSWNGPSRPTPGPAGERYALWISCALAAKCRPAWGISLSLRQFGPFQLSSTSAIRGFLILSVLKGKLA